MATTANNSEAVNANNMVQNATIGAIKVVTYPVALAFQVGADLTNLAQAKAINLIDGTPVAESTKSCENWKEQQYIKVINAGIAADRKLEEIKNKLRKQDVARLEQQAEKVKSTITDAVPAPPAEEKVEFIPINQRNSKKPIQNTEAPLMSANAVLQPE